MGLFTSVELNNMQDLYVDQLQDLYDAEQRIVKSSAEDGRQGNISRNSRRLSRITSSKPKIR